MSEKFPSGETISFRLKTIKQEVILLLDDVLEFYFIEDINKAYHSGKITFQDRYGLFEGESIVGQELLYFLFGEKKSSQYIFQIYNINEITPMAQSSGDISQAVYEMYFTSFEYIKLCQFKYSKSWKEERISTIIKQIYSQMADTSPDLTWKYFEESKEKIDFCMPYWTPLESINWLMRRASGVESGLPGYLFYKNSKGMNLVTIDKLLQDESTIEKDGSEKMSGIMKYSFYLSDDFYDNKILEWRVNGPDKQSEYMLEGGTNLGFDFETKQLIQEKFTYKDVVKKYTLNGKKTLFPDYSNTKNRYENYGDSNYEILKNIGYSDMIKRYITQLQIKAACRGHEDRYVGMLAELDWPSNKSDTGKHKQLDGRYIITTIVNHYRKGTKPEWRQDITFNKLSYTDSEFDFLLNA